MRIRIKQFKNGRQGEEINHGIFHLDVTKQRLGLRRRKSGCATDLNTTPETVFTVTLGGRIYDAQVSPKWDLLSRRTIILPADVHFPDLGLVPAKIGPTEKTTAAPENEVRLFVVRLALAHGPQIEVVAPGKDWLEAVDNARTWWETTHPATHAVDASTSSPLNYVTEPTLEMIRRGSPYVQTTRPEPSPVTKMKCIRELEDRLDVLTKKHNNLCQSSYHFGNPLSLDARVKGDD